VILTRNRDAKLGMWKKGTSLETPGQYKKRAKREGEAPEIADDAAEAKEEGSWFQLKLKKMKLKKMGLKKMELKKMELKNIFRWP